MKFVQFRLRMLFMVMIIAAIGVSLWMKFVRPNVSEVNFNSYAMVVHFSDHWHRERGLAYWDDETGEVVYPDGAPTDGPLLHDHFILLPWSFLTTIATSTLVGGVACVLAFRIWHRWRTLPSKTHDA